MKFGVFGTGVVGETIASKLIALGHEVSMGSRTALNEKAAAWVQQAGERASHGTFADAALRSDILFNCTHGEAALDVLGAAGHANLSGKVLVDVSNPLDFSKGAPPRLFVGNDDSLGERIQRAFPSVRVVKTLNTVNCLVMVDPARVPGDHTMFLCGDDPAAKATVQQLLQSFGWRDLIDLGDITNARATEALLPLWIRLWGVLKTGDFNLKVVR
jgi:8-hydroxy-5-deazaflavin:NADPH oxidoreductase